FDSNNTLCQIKISEGKFRQVRRMFAKEGHTVLDLRRLSFGDIELDTSLKLGEFRDLTPTELELLKRSVNFG
ncbi:MAG: 16S rRNA pseudouridine(516) synthase, partial [Eubacteriales bacterium]|nr:16S rRNA pseudouridine(516) synthase [Eubacteriales bacterium]